MRRGGQPNVTKLAKLWLEHFGDKVLKVDEVFEAAFAPRGTELYAALETACHPILPSAYRLRRALEASAYRALDIGIGDRELRHYFARVGHSWQLRAARLPVATQEPIKEDLATV